MMRLVVPGVPVPQGSKKPWGAEDNPHTRAWRSSIADEARKLMQGDPPLMGPVRVLVEFTFPRPKAHYRTGRYTDWLRPNAPIYHTSAPDLDKLQRAIGDALQGVILRNDSQIAGWTTLKRYGHPAGAEITIELLPRQDVLALESAS